MKYLRRLTFLILLCISGCSPTFFEHPLVEPKSSKPCPELYGAFKGVEGANKIQHLYIGSAGEGFPKGFLRFIVIEQSSDKKLPLRKPLSFVAFAEPMKNSYIIHVPIPKAGKQEGLKEQEDLLGNKWDTQQKKYYALFQIVKTKTGLQFFYLGNDFVAEQIQSEKLAGRIERETNKGAKVPDDNRRTVFVTAKTKELHKYFEKIPFDKLFEFEGPVFDVVE